jgi:tryptophanyl-tRNA synthetase
LCEGSDPAVVAEEIGDGGGGVLKKRLTEAVNTELAPLRARRAELEKDPAYVADILRRGNQRANEVAETTLDEVRARMGMVYT